ncbi:lytic transglycosylase domain-containing protein [Alicyclobacillus mengziensis]|uniref:LysM peptidoglycan-binding domain-containing protein n=1 Tax=Alicyclobacillus mengziensis TaxID=2931921 RepID=A0A9X7VV52_9BACL|nr:lytic transglycosylase domain-containing protein [Alicyclobacillus mengziensis]QSO45726.1 LysM peptidoglycan-binding domain-containing protein [Alicyclobacillus mengziensis]
MSVRTKWLALTLALLVTLCYSFVALVNFVHVDTNYTVHQRDNLLHIAQTHHTSVQDLTQANHQSSSFLRIHHTLDIPTPDTATSPVSKPRRFQAHSQSVLNTHKTHRQKVNEPSFTVIHTVQPGDTLWHLAVVNHTTVANLTAINQLHSDIIYPGQKLRVYIGTKAAYQKVVLKQYAKVGLPINLVPIYQAAGKKYDIPWNVLAAIHRVETHFSTGYVVSYAGAEGPMQFMPATFQEYAVRAPGQTGAPDINNVDDAIYTCAHMLQADGYRKNPVAALYAYNHSFTYVHNVLAFARHFEV